MMEKRTKFSIFYYLLIFALIFFLESLFFSGPTVKDIPYSKFRDYIAKDSLESAVITTDKIYGVLKGPDTTKTAKADTTKKDPVKKSPAVKKTGEKHSFLQIFKRTPWHLNLDKLEQTKQKQVALQFTVIPLEDRNLISDLQKHDVEYRGKIESDWLKNIFLNWIIPFGLLIFIWIWVFRKMGKGPSALNVGKSKAKIYEVDPSKRITFNDVAGIDEAVEEVKEVVNFLKEPGKYTRLGAKLPKGILLVGPPGTGKTLLARAVAGEAGVPFFSISGSDFVEMFVGVGAARVRDLFAEAKSKAPCIIFIDELDAVGKSRGGAMPMGGGYDERENTLNQLLTEMDGFDPQIGIVMMGATNRPEVLDTALLRPGRFDRQILVDKPDLIGREQIFKVHTRGLLLGKNVDLHKLAGQTPGFAGAEIANVCNEAALLASRNGRDEITMDDFQNAFERIIGGLEKKNKLINPHEREIVAYHESGHAIIGHLTPGADPVQKVSIVPRGIGALGYTLQTPLEDRYLMTRTELLGKLKGLLGGRAAEDVVFGEISTGASNDLERVSRIAREMIVQYGMSKKLPNLSLVDRNQNYFLGQGPSTSRRSEKIEQIVDEEMMDIIQSCYTEDKEILQKNRKKLEKMAQTLLEKEKLDDKDIITILGKRA
jgi:cell division protease FtsH